LRYVFYNELIEVIPLSYSKNKQTLQSSFIFTVELFGYDGSCIDLQEKRGDEGYSCSNDIKIFKINEQKNQFQIKDAVCSKTSSGNCKVYFHVYNIFIDYK